MSKTYRMTKEKLDKILSAQKTKVEKIYKEKEDELREYYENKIKEICDNHYKQIEEIKEESYKESKLKSKKRLEKYKELLKEKNEIIDNFSKENTELRDKIKRYKKAYEIYKPYRNRIIEIAKELGLTSEQVTKTAGTMKQFFSKLSDLAEMLERKGYKIDDEVEELMRVDEPQEEYRFIFESESTSRKELEIEAEALWNALTSSGLKPDKYEDMEIYSIEELSE